MEQPCRNSVSDSKIWVGNTLEKEKSARRHPTRTDLYHTLTDASLFSSSLPVLHGKLDFNGLEQNRQSFDDDFPRLTKARLEDEVTGPLENTDHNTVGSCLPGDEDELLAGLMDDFDLSELPTQIEDLDVDFFRSGGGLEIEPDNHENLVNGFSRLTLVDGMGKSNISLFGFANGLGTGSGEHPLGEHPSRTLFVRNINSNVEDTELRSLFEQYGDIRKLYTACKHRGFVMISYYDIRAARTAMRALQNKPLRRRKLDIHFSIPKDNPSEKDINQGTLVVFNLDTSVTNDDLLQIFGAYGEVKEIRETPHKRHHKFIEFYDVRAAEAALKALNRSDIAGKRIKLEPSRPGGARRSLIQQLTQEQDPDESRTFLHQVGLPLGDSPPGSWPNFGSPVERNSLNGYSQSPKFGSISPVESNHMSGLASILPSHISSPVKIAPIGKDPGRISHLNQVAQGNYSVPDPKLLSSPGPVSPFDFPKPSSIGTLSGPQFLWGSPSIHSEHISSPSWPSSLKGQAFPSGGQRVGVPYPNLPASSLDSRHHVGSAPSGIPLERHFGFYPDSPDTSYIKQAAYGVVNFSRNNGNHDVNVGAPGLMNLGVSFAGNFPDSSSSSSRMMSIPRNSPIYYGNGSLGGSIIDGINDRNRIRRADAGSLMDSKKQYKLDLEKIISAEDNRTTLMIKNIPNKYTSKMLLAAIDETHKGAYDFLYLPIDFKNKCNVGYAFINMVSPSHIISFYEIFNGKKWEKFNSEKVASLAYARIQGKTALISHFQNSSLMNEDKSCRPIVFQSETQDNSDLEPYPSGNLNIFVRQPDGSYAGDSLDSPTADSDTVGSC